MGDYRIEIGERSMRFLYVSVQEKWDWEICESLEILEQEVKIFSIPEKIRTNDFVILSETNRYALVETLQKKDFDFVFRYRFGVSGAVFYRQRTAGDHIIKNIPEY